MNALRSSGPRSRPQLGKAAETAAALHLHQRGCQILARNYRGRRGEIDIIARDGNVIVFVEVKARRAGVHRSLEAVDAHKRRRIVRAALEYVSTRRLHGVSVRFDVAAVVLAADGKPMDVHVVENAFSADE